LGFSFAPLRYGCPPWATHLSYPLALRYRAGVQCFRISAFLRVMDSGYSSWEGVERRASRVERQTRVMRGANGAIQKQASRQARLPESLVRKRQLGLPKRRPALLPFSCHFVYVDSLDPSRLIRRFSQPCSSFGAAFRQSFSTYPKVSIRPTGCLAAVYRAAAQPPGSWFKQFSPLFLHAVANCHKWIVDMVATLGSLLIEGVAIWWLSSNLNLVYSAQSANGGQFAKRMERSF
jgi:hypothetical protein